MSVKAKYLLASLLTIIVCTACVFLPVRLLGAQDASLTSKIEEHPLGSYSANIVEKSSLVESIALYSASNVNIVRLSNGQKHTYESIQNVLYQQMDELNALGISLLEAQRTNFSIDSDNTSVVLYVSVDDPGYSATFWDIHVQTSTGDGTIVIDDASGKIVRFSIQYRSLGNTSTIDYPSIAQSWGEYLGLEYQGERNYGNPKISTGETVDGMEAPSYDFSGGYELYYQKDNQDIIYTIYFDENYVHLMPL